MSEPAHILVVDDHDEIRNSVSSYLERNGMRTSVAESAAEMDAQRARHSFDLIVLDVMMPGEDGLRCCHVNSPNLQVGKLFVDQAACAADF
ncbi:response regulator, partial [Sulfitobacter sp. 1A05707]|uniref:response regulator n=1 Tax=Sulfitobacter sp. 1A05707 TaxID=3368560 RepID=UPI003744DC16